MPSFLKQVSGADRETVVSQRLTEPQPEFWGTQPGLRSGRDSSCNVGRVSGGPGGAWPRGHVEKGPVWAARRDGQWSISARPAPAKMGRGGGDAAIKGNVFALRILFQKSWVLPSPREMQKMFPEKALRESACCPFPAPP